MESSLAGREASERAFESLYRRHRGDVYRFVLRDVRNPEDAEDVTQTAFLNAYRALQQGSEPEKPRAWLMTIAQNVSRRRFRARSSRPHEVELDPELAVAPEADGPTAAEIREALLRLRPNQRAVIVLREIGGLSYREIAETLGLSVPAVETLLFRSRRALREELAAEEREVVRVGGIVLWPLPAAFSDALGSLAVWLGRRGVAVKVAGAVGAAVIGTGAAVQAGALPVPGNAPPPDREEPVAVAAASVPDEPPRARAAAPGKTVEKKATKPRRESVVSRPARAREASPAAEGAADPAASGALPALPAPDVAIPEVSVPEISVPLPVETPDVPALPDVEVPELPELPELPDVPAADDLLPPDG